MEKKDNLEYMDDTEDTQPSTGLIMSRVLAALFTVISLHLLYIILKTNANLPPGACGTGLVGPSILLMLFIIPTLISVVVWIHKESENYEGNSFLRIAVPIVSAILIFLAMSRCSSNELSSNMKEWESEEKQEMEMIEQYEEEASDGYMGNFADSIHGLNN